MNLVSHRRGQMIGPFVFILFWFSDVIGLVHTSSSPTLKDITVLFLLLSNKVSEKTPAGYHLLRSLTSERTQLSLEGAVVVRGHGSHCKVSWSWEVTALTGRCQAGVLKQWTSISCSKQHLESPASVGPYLFCLVCWDSTLHLVQHWGRQLFVSYSVYFRHNSYKILPFSIFFIYNILAII